MLLPLVTAGATGNFVNAMSGTGKTVNTTGFTITGADAGNYLLTQPTTTASIIGITITITGVTASNKVYNGTTAATTEYRQRYSLRCPGR